MNRLARVGSLACAAVLLVGQAGWNRSAASGRAADLVYIDANVVTMDAAHPTARAIAIRAGRILAVGTDTQIKQFIGVGTHTTNLHGLTVLPGFIDPHSHALGYAFLRDPKYWTDVSSVNIYFKPPPGDPRCANPHDPQRCFIPVETEDDVVERIWQAARKPRVRAVYAANYDAARLGHSWGCPGPRTNVGFACPNLEDGHARADLDEISTAIPIFVTAESGHLAYVNTKALELLNICGTDVATRGCTAAVTNPLQETVLARFGQLDEDLALYTDGFAIGQILKADPLAVAADIATGIGLYAQHGYTLVQEGAAGLFEVKLYLGAIKADPNFPVTAAMMMYDSSANFGVTLSLAEQAQQLIDGHPDIFIGGIGEEFADGSPQGYTADLSRPYAQVYPPFAWPIFPRPYSGLPDLTTADLQYRTLASHAAGWPIMIHQNGDQSIRNAVQALRAARKIAPSRYRDVVLHAPYLKSPTFSQIKALHDPISFLTSNLHFWGLPDCQQVLGPDYVRAYPPYPAGEAERLGLIVTLHSDSPVNPPDPLFEIWVAKTRNVQQPPWYPNTNPQNCPAVMASSEAITIRQGIAAFTTNAAWQYGLSRDLGSIDPGKLADLVILSADPLAMEEKPDGLKRIRVIGTVHNGLYNQNPHAIEAPIWPG